MLYGLARPLLFTLDAERAHRLIIAALKRLPSGPPTEPDPMLGVRIADLDFPNPVGLAAGFDKDAEVFAQMFRFGFGFVEVGSLTPQPQRGNDRPRLFRLAEDRAIINRLGFNNRGQAESEARLARRKASIVGVNLGANRDSADPIADYVHGAKRLGARASYLTINVSSPNTPGLRGLQQPATLAALLAAVKDARSGTAPIFLKVAPDLELAEVDAIARAAIDGGTDALIVGNTTVSRPALRSRHRDEAGGLSGAPLKPLALQRLRDFRRATGGELPLIACGGIGSGADAFERILAGASLVQLYTALVYEGPGLVKRILSDLRTRLAERGFTVLSDAVGTEAR
jgi:dihydroorotate dehydrogenase